MNIIKRLFCKHIYKPIENNYVMLGWEKCGKCGKEIYTGKNCEFTKFELPEIIVETKRIK